MDEGFTLDTPAQISMWVLLSRRHQVQLHLKGLKVPGIVKAVREQIPGAENVRRAKDCVVPIEYAISQAGGQVDYNLVNVHVMLNSGGLFIDKGVYPDMSHVEDNTVFVQWYKTGKLEIVLTLDEPRDATNELFVPA